MPRPRSVSLPPTDMIKLGQEMVDWVKSNSPVHLSQWYSLHKRYTEHQWDAMQQLPEFLPYYEQALKLVGLQYLLKGSDVEPSIKQRWLRVYYRDLRKKEDQDKQDDLERELEQKKKIIDHQSQKDNSKQQSPNQEQIDYKHQNMILQNQNEELKNELEKLKST